MKKEVMENGRKNLKEFVYRHRKIIIITGVFVMAEIALRVGNKSTVETAQDIATESEGYDIWAMFNGMDEKVVEFAPKLQQFSEENGISMMCEII